MTILFNIASRERPTEFAELLQNITDLAISSDHIIVAKLDRDDPTRPAYEGVLLQYSSVQPKWGSSYSKVNAINRDIPVSGWDVLVNVSDDQRFIVKGFDDIILKNIEGDCLVHFPDSYKRAACSTMSIFTHGLWNLLGQKVYNEDYVSLWCDNEATEVAKILRVYRYVPQIIFRHDHYSTTGKKQDGLYRRNNTYNRDRSIYNTRHSRNFDLPVDDASLPNILIKYPTRGRWRLFAETLDNIHSTIRTHKFYIRVTADLDDPEMNSNEVKDLCKRYPHVSLEFDNHDSKIHACNNLMPQNNYDMIVLMSDDMRFTEFGWDTEMWRQIRGVWPEGTDYFAHFNDGYVGDRLPTLNICGSDYYKRFGYLYHPSYKSVSCDAENMYVAQMLGRRSFVG